MIKISDVQASYIAGIVDGEGSVGIQRLKYAGKNPAYAVSVRLYSTDKNVLATIKKWIGIGRLRVQKRKNEKWKPLWRLYIMSNQAIELLSFIKPFLIIKKRHANNAVEFQKLRRRTGKGLSTLERKRQNRHYEISKRLNRRGR